MDLLPQPLRTDGSNAFAHHSMAVRVPGIISEVLDRNPDYPPEIKSAFERLQSEIMSDAPLRLFTPPAPDFDLWTQHFEPYSDSSWLDTEWFLAEMLAYRLMTEAADYWSTARDPFEPLKRDEIESHELWETLDEAQATEGSASQRLIALFTFSLWGNRFDLSLKKTAALGIQASDDHLIVDDIPRIVAHLLSCNTGDIHFIMDNAGTEQALDFVLVDYLLSSRIAESVTLHLKMHPVLVSDSTTADVHLLLTAMLNKGGDAAQLASRLNSFLESGHLRIRPDFFWTTPGRLWELPPRLQHPFQNATLVVAKGDINYRRITHDAIWPPGTPLASAIHAFPAPILALRTLKSDTLIGVDSATIEQLNRSAPQDWRTSGAYAVAQCVL